jgi:hypothetical protein
MVRAILEGRKTQTRRIVKRIPCDCGFDWQPEEMCATTPEGYQTAGHSGKLWCGCCADDFVRCPYGQPGDRLWVREKWCSEQKNIVGYAADAECGAWIGDGGGGRFWIHHGYIIESDAYRKCFKEPARTFSLSTYGGRWRPSIHMPRWASRITLEITGVRVERLQEISEEDAIAEGSQIPIDQLPKTCRQAVFSERDQFAKIWESINGKKHPWESNPWVWVIQFRRTA